MPKKEKKENKPTSLSVATKSKVAKSAIERRFHEFMEFLLNTKAFYRLEAERNDLEMDEEEQELAVEADLSDVIHKDIFPELLMTAWVMSSFAFFEQCFEDVWRYYSNVFNKKVSNKNFKKGIEDFGKFEFIKNHLNDEMGITIDQDLWARIKFYVLLRNQLVHGGRQIRDSKQLYKLIPEFAHIICRKTNNKMSKIVIHKDFASSMCRDSEDCLIGLWENGKMKWRESQQVDL